MLNYPLLISKNMIKEYMRVNSNRKLKEVQKH